MLNKDLLQVSNEVASALAENRPVVALESTVISHGLPRPQNLQTANRLEQLVRNNGAIPATIAILNGRLTAGLDRNQLQRLAEEDGVRKISIRDLAVAVAKGWNGATTVASTSWIASRSGIKVFATGGIGGVHRGTPLDISADLPALAQTPIVVVCSGAKIVLDLPATREWLETHGVTVVGYQCSEMPAFYTRRSGLPIDVRADDPSEVAEIFNTQLKLGVETALLVTVPVPEQFEVPAALLHKALDHALEEASQRGITGREVTPFLLSRMVEQSEGATLHANIALLENNVKMATGIARALSP